LLVLALAARAFSVSFLLRASASLPSSTLQRAQTQSGVDSVGFESEHSQDWSMQHVSVSDYKAPEAGAITVLHQLRVPHCNSHLL
jgi:hypothetical protein